MINNFQIPECMVNSKIIYYENKHTSSKIYSHYASWTTFVQRHIHSCGEVITTHIHVVILPGTR